MNQQTKNKLRRGIAVLAMVSTIYSSIVPTYAADAAAQNMINQNKLERLSAELGIPVDILKESVDKGYTIDELKKAKFATFGSNDTFTKELENLHKEIATADEVKIPVNENDIPTDEEKLAKKPFIEINQDGSLKEGMSIASTTTADPTVEIPTVSAQMDTAPYTVSMSDANISPLTGALSLEQGDMMLVGRNGMNFALNRSYSSDNAQYYGMDVSSSTAAEYSYYVKFDAQISNQAKGYKKSWMTVLDIEKDTNFDGIADSSVGGVFDSGTDYSSSVAYSYTGLDALYNDAKNKNYPRTEPWSYQAATQGSPAYNYRHYWETNVSTIVDYTDASLPNQTYASTNSKDQWGPYTDRTVAQNKLNTISPSQIYGQTEWQDGSSTYRKVRSVFAYANSPNATIDLVQTGSHTEHNNITKKSYQETMYPIGTGWSWDVSSIENDSRSGKKFLHIAGSGTYEINDTTLIGYPWKDITIASDVNVNVGGEVSSTKVTTTKDNRSQYFNAEGRLLQISDAYGNNIQFFYGNVSTYGKVLTKIKNSIDNEIDISYSTTEVKLTQGNQTVVYTKGQSTDSAKKEILASVTDQAGRVTQYGYSFKPASFNLISNYPELSNPYALLTQINHPTGAQTIVKYDDLALTRYIGSNAVNQAYRVQSLDNQVTYTDGTTQSNNKNTMTYNGDLGSSYSTNMTVSATMNNGLTATVFEYKKQFVDSSIGSVYYNTKTTTTDLTTTPTTKVVTNTYDETHRWPVPLTVSQQTTKNGVASSIVTTKKEYDEYGNVLSDTDPLNAKTTYTYDSTSHRLLTMSLPISSTLTQKTTFVRNGKGDITQETTIDQANKTLRQAKYDYDSYGNKVAVHTTDNGQDIVQNFKYNESAPYKSAFVTEETQDVTDVNGNVSKVTLAFDHDTVIGKPLNVTDGNNNSTTYKYDVLGRMILQSNPDTSSIKLTYNDKDNYIEQLSDTGPQKDGIPLKSRVQFSPLGFKTETGVYEDTEDQGTYHTTAKYTYDSYGRIVASEDALQNITASIYDSYGRVLQTTYPDSTVQLFSYDDIARTKTSTDPDSNKIRETYDVMGRQTLQELVTPTGNKPMATSVYDLSGDLISYKEANGTTTQYQYDAMKQMTSVIDGLNNRTQYTFDMRGQVTQIKYADGKTVQKKYDEAGELIQQTDASGNVQNNTYDANGNLTTQTYQGNTVTLTYNSRNQVKSKSSGSAQITFDYNLNGQRTQMKDITGKTEYKYDYMGNPSKVIYPDGLEVGYTYDLNGHRTSMRDPFGKTYTYSTDNMNRLTSVKSGAIEADVEYKYKNGGAVQSFKLGNKVETTFDYNQYNFITSEVQKKSDDLSSVLNTFGYGYDPNNNQTSKTENGQSYSFTYDKLNRISTSSQFNESYTYDLQGNRQTQQSDNMALSESASHYVYDKWNELVGVDKDDSPDSVLYNYNGDGLLVERTTSEYDTNRYYYDGANIIAEAKVVDGVPTLVAHYIRGNAGQLVAREDATGDKAYYTLNAHGDVTELRDSQGNLLNSYSYDIWGNPQTVQEKVPNPFRYSSEYWDDFTKLEYLRARWYDPSIGRFLTQDTIEGDVKIPSSWNLYAYAGNNPLRYSDPSGHCFWDMCIVETTLLMEAIAAAGMVAATVGAGVVAGQQLADFRTRTRPVSQTRYAPYKPTIYPSLYPMPGDDDSENSNRDITLFHATTLPNAFNIVNHGIDVNYSTVYKDFGKAFYVTTDMNQAIEWAQLVGKKNNDGVIIQFTVKESELASFDGRIFMGADDDWADFVENCRVKGYSEAQYDYIEGPMLVNWRDAGTGKTLLYKGHQLAVASDRMADFLSYHVRSIILSQFLIGQD